MLSQIKSIVALLVVAPLVAAAKKGEEEPAGNPLVTYVTDLVNPVIAACLGTGTDAVGLVASFPGFAASVFVWLTDQARDFPALVTNVYNGDAATLNSLTSFCSSTAGIIFVVYASLTALNLLLGLMVSVKDYFNGYLTLPTSVPIINMKLKGPPLAVRNLIQAEILDRIKNAKVGTWIVPLEGQSVKPSLRGAVPVLASATAACMLLSCAPAIHALIQGGADKAKAEALIYTLGLGLGLQWLVGRI